MVEFALILPLLLLVTAGGLILSLAAIETQQLTHAAQQAADYGSSSENPCPDALQAAEEVLGHPVANGSTCTIDPGPPRTIRLLLVGSTWSPPFLEPVTVAGKAAAVIEEAP
jgi:hypothetical protein